MTHEVLGAVRDLRATFAERAEEAESARRLSDESIRDLVDAGVLRMLQPSAYGGREDNPVHFYDVVREIAAACGSTGWVASVLGVHPWHLGCFPERAQEDVWGEDPDTILASSYAPVGRLTPVDGGFRLSGHWRFSSGCDHAEWALLGAMVVGPEGLPLDFITTLVPASDFRVVDVWDAVGLRGTGSNDVVVEDAFVPRHRTLRNYEMGQLKVPGQRVNRGPLYRMPFGAIFTSAVAAPVVGAVAGGLDAFVSAMQHRNRLSLGGGHFVEDQFAQVAVARASSDVDAAILQTDHNIGAMYALAREQAEIPMELRLRTRRDQVRATERALAAVEVVFKIAGATSLRRGNPIERAWRDAHAGSVHVANDVERTLALYGKGRFGLTVEDNLV